MMGEYEDRYPESDGRDDSGAPQDGAIGSPPPRGAERFSLRTWFGGAAASPVAPAASDGHGPPPSDVRSAEPDWRHEPRAAAALRYSASLAAPSSEGRFRGIGPRGYVRSSQRIYEDICDRLADHPLIDASDIQVTISGGDVTLTGSVDDAMTASQVDAVAREVPGVKSVRNNLRVRPASTGRRSVGRVLSMRGD